jgi:molybdopterin molybdotransferase/putative molybdopterin biosynthesis protein
MDNSPLPTKEEALSSLFSKWKPALSTERVPVSEAFGRVPTEDIASLISLPMVRASKMDGLAVRSESFSEAHNPDTKDWILGRDYFPGDTGDDFPDIFDAVVPIEEINFDEKGKPLFTPNLSLKAGDNIRFPGSQLAKGEILAQTKIPLNSKDLAMLLMGGHTRVPVYSRPRVAFIPTGNELIPAGDTLARGKYFETNGLMVKTALESLGAIVSIWPILPDDSRAIARNLEKALAESDLVVINGGSSKGREDLTPAILKERGQLICHGVAAAPGRPICLSLIAGKPVVNLPGPLVAAYYGLEWCLRAIVSQFFGSPPPTRPTIKARLIDSLKGPIGLSFLFMLELCSSKEGQALARPLDIRTCPTWLFGQANGQFMTDLSGEEYPEGGYIEAQLLRPFQSLSPI